MRLYLKSLQLGGSLLIRGGGFGQLFVRVWQAKFSPSVTSWPANIDYIVMMSDIELETESDETECEENEQTI